MKTEITLETKARFFAQYWNQKIFFTSNNQEKPHKNSFGRLINNKDFLVLNPLSSITDEDALIVCIMSRTDAKWYKMKPEQLIVFAIHFSEWNVKGADLLRSKGYALSWMGLSVEEMIKAGWIKLSA